MNFIYGMITMWLILSTFIYITTFHTSQTTNWDTWFYWIVCFPLFLLGFPIYLLVGVCQILYHWAHFNWEHEWRWKWDDIKEKFHYWY